MKSISRTFLSGLGATIPIVITVYILYWLASSAEAVLGGMIRVILPSGVYRPGMGVAAGMLLIFLVGLFLQAWIFRRIFSWGEAMLERVPLVKTLYGSVRDLMNFFSGSSAGRFNQVVSVAIPNSELRLMGLVTRDQVADVDPGLAPENAVAVYFPMSYQIGGYTVFVPRSALTPVNLSINAAMRFAVTAGMSAATDGHTAENGGSGPRGGIS